MRSIAFVVYAGYDPAYSKGEPLRSPSDFGGLFTVLLNVVEAQRENFDDYIKEDFRPIFFFVFSFHFQS